MVKTRCDKNGADDDDIVLPSLLLKSSRSMRNLMNSSGTGGRIFVPPKNTSNVPETLLPET